MMPSLMRFFPFSWAHFGLLRAASLLVPSTLRADWRREWRGELWHVRRACSVAGEPTWKAEREAAVFCLGLFRTRFACGGRMASRAGR